MKQETHSRGFRGRFSVLTAGAACLAAALLTGCPTGTAYGPLSNSDLRLFQSRYVYGVSGEATDVAAADFNGDNIPDLAAINNDQQNVSVLLSEGAVQYVKAKDYDLGDTPSALAVGDANGDGRPDILVCNETFGQVTVLTSRGDGEFNEPALWELPAGATPRGLAVADVNGDGLPDIVTANAGLNAVAVLLGTAEGGFEAARSFPAGTGPRWVIAADLTGDGQTDVLSVNRDSNDLSLFVRSGANLNNAVSLRCGLAPRMAAAGDLNGDGLADLVVSNTGTNDLSVLLGQGGGAFAADRRVALGKPPTRLSLGDFNRDGRLDAAVLLFDSADTGSLGVVAVLPGDGAGGLGAPLFFGSGWQSFGLCAADMDLDGAPDLVTADTSMKAVAVLRGRGDGTFESDRRFATGVVPSAGVTGDFTGDGHVDVLVANARGGSLILMAGDGAGRFAAQAAPVPVGGIPIALAAGDVNADGAPDVLVSLKGQKTALLLLGSETGQFVAGPAVKLLPDGSAYMPVAYSLTLGDVNSDGRPDLLSANSGADSVSVALGRGDGTFAAPAEMRNISYPLRAGLADVDRDGNPDIIATSSRDPEQSSDQAEPRIVRLLGVGDGTFNTESMLRVATGSYPADLALGDVNGDGRTDAVTAHPGSDGVYIAAGAQGGRLTAGDKLGVGDLPVAVVLPDVNADGKADILTTHAAGYAVVRIGRGEGRYDSSRHFLTGDTALMSVYLDVNGDQIPDLVTLNRGTSDISVLLGQR
ncbi:MAG TPA: VCBS repeat-containing protein [Candidatus Hydrogenedentes bacterium]|nr:VCBS repeat-containing protein [Candidatus Hydrogenedentota bacterium]